MEPTAEPERAAAGPGNAESPGGWVPARTGDGSWTLLHPEHGQACHSTAGAWTEAVRRYAWPTRLAERVRAAAGEAAEPIALLDVGTGLGLNLAAALADVELAGGRLRAVTLELDPAVLAATRRLAAAVQAAAGGERGGGRELGLPREPELAPPGELPIQPPIQPAWDRVLRALAEAERDPAASGPVDLGGGSTLRLVLGDARRTLPALPASARFDAVFLDPFSPRAEPALWDLAFLTEIARRMRPGAWLSTYSAAFSVRCALAAAGLRVGAGPRVGVKSAGTLASPDLEPPALDARTARRIRRRLEGGPGGAGDDLPAADPADSGASERSGRPGTASGGSPAAKRTPHGGECPPLFS